ncbi:hypothetical protein BH09ACT4_BH09ACT4_10080 [soil metagenome]
MTRLPGSGVVPRAFALAAAAIVTVFLVLWIVGDASGVAIAIVIEVLAVGLAARSLFVGVGFDGDAVVVRGWFRNFRYGPGDLTAVTAIPYWKFLDAKDPILALLKFTPRSGWVREIAATVSWKDSAAGQALAITERISAQS